MRTLIIGDVHGCKDELSELLDRVAPDRAVLVGDLFTKGPKPGGVYKFIRRHGIEAVLGNHDQRLLDIIADLRPKDAAGRRCVARLDKADPSWREWTSALPLFVDAAPFTVVHASMHPSGKKKRTSRYDALLRRRWPEDRKGLPLWHEVYWGKRRIVFGHDALRGLVRVERDGEPIIIGLDTGCVYGGLLSGYIVEEDLIVQQQARKVYCKPG